MRILLGYSELNIVCGNVLLCRWLFIYYIKVMFIIIYNQITIYKDIQQ